MVIRPTSLLVILLVLSLSIIALSVQRVVAAPASTIVVNTLSDTTHAVPCAGAPNDCSLRDAINIANGSTFNNIRFAASMTGKIVLSSPLPAIATDGTWIDGRDSGNGPVDISLDGENITGAMVNIAASYVTLSNLKLVGGDPSHEVVFITKGRGTQIAYNRFSSYYNEGSGCVLAPGRLSPALAILVGSGVTGNGTAGQGSAYIYGNVIGCAFVAIYIQGSYVYAGEAADGSPGANFIGIDQAAHSMPNQSSIDIFGDHNRVINNRIVGNGLGVLLDNAAFNLVMTNTIRSNTGPGVELIFGARYNTIGGQISGPPGMGNVISANTDGIDIEGSATRGNNIFGNKIGTDAAGAAADGNLGNGIIITAGAQLNNVGSGSAAEQNVISGNGGNGVQIGSGAHDNAVLDNAIGTDTALSASIQNGASGVELFAGAYQNTVSGNGINHNLYGVYLTDSGTMSNSVGNNSIVFSRSDGVRLQGGTHGNQISGNSVQSGAASGIYLTSAAQYNQLTGNDIYQNAFYGLLLDGGNTIENVVSGGSLYANGFDGIGERNSAGNNRWTQISTHDNGGLGIDKFASSNSSNIVDLPFPVVISAALSVSTVSVYGRADPTMYIDASNYATVTVELYTVATNRSSYGEGRNYLGSAVTDGSGNWQVDFPETIIGCYTAFETIRGVAVIVPLDYSTEFGPNTCRVMLPLMMR